MKIELVKPVGVAAEHQPGSVLEVSDARGFRWIASGIAKAVQEVLPPEPEPVSKPSVKGHKL